MASDSGTQSQKAQLKGNYSTVSVKKITADQWCSVPQYSHNYSSIKNERHAKRRMHAKEPAIPVVKLMARPSVGVGRFS